MNIYNILYHNIILNFLVFSSFCSTNHPTPNALFEHFYHKVTFLDILNKIKQKYETCERLNKLRQLDRVHWLYHSISTYECENVLYCIGLLRNEIQTKPNVSFSFTYFISFIPIIPHPKPVDRYKG